MNCWSKQKPLFSRFYFNPWAICINWLHWHYICSFHFFVFKYCRWNSILLHQKERYMPCIVSELTEWKGVPVNKKNLDFTVNENVAMCIYTRRVASKWISELFILKNLYLETVFLLGKTCFMGLTESVAQTLMASRDSTAPVSLLNHCELKLKVV